jgi:hypothetical protein
MRRLLPAALAAAFFVSGAGAFAAQVGALFPPLGAEVTERLALLTGLLTPEEKKRKTALIKAQKALAVQTDDVAKALATTTKVVAALDAVLGTDEEVGPLLDVAVEQFHSNAVDRTNQANLALSRLPEGKVKTSATGLINKATAADGLFGEATTRVERLKVVGKTYAALLKAEKLLAKPGPGLVAFTRIDAKIGKLRVQTPGLPLVRLLRAVYDQTADRLTISLVESAVDPRPAVSLAIAAPGVGGRGILVDANSWYQVDGASPHVALTSGTFTFTVWDLENNAVAGTFTATFQDGAKLTKGVFSSFELEVQQAPPPPP